MDNQTLQEISRAIGRLEGTVETGFCNITSRLDKMNGHIAKNIKDIEKLKSDNDRMKGKIAGIGLVAGLIGTLLGFWLSFMR